MRGEYLKIKIVNDKLVAKQSQSAAMHREIIQKLENDLWSMIAKRNELYHQLRDSNLMIRMEREEYEKCIDTANQCSMALQIVSNPNEEKALTSHQLANSMELPGHAHGATMMSKVQHGM